jgi:hypothetical protein
MIWSDQLTRRWQIPIFDGRLRKDSGIVRGIG